ncbi:M48 family metalloprotease [Polycladidibacter stylochi]|uniref:M48 family metalloprotease n=1 Tax=Polycladidibacter stylochi TaxID=1807766 RepID=UPI000ACECEE5|nr:M48 family metalloprotease [Pseudovibrio stylochi]
MGIYFREAAIFLLHIISFLLIMIFSSAVGSVPGLILANYVLNNFNIDVPNNLYVIAAFGFCILGLFIIFNLRFPFFINGFIKLEFNHRSPSNREVIILQEAMNLLESEARKNKVPLPKITFTICDDKEVNACAYGTNMVGVTTGLLNHAAKQGDATGILASIIAHEIGHIRGGETIPTVVTILSLVPIKLFDILLAILCRLPFIGIFAALLYYISTVIFNIIVNSSRFTSVTLEYRADRFAYRALGSDFLIDFFEYIKTQERSEKGILNNLLKTHPPTELRICALLELDRKSKARLSKTEQPSCSDPSTKYVSAPITVKPPDLSLNENRTFNR